MGQETGSSKSPKPWYRHWLAITIIVFTFPITLPLFGMYYVWKRTKWNIALKILATIILIPFFIAGMAAVFSEHKESEKRMASSGEEKTEDNTATTTAAPSQPEVPALPHFRDGIHSVGTDIEPGTYRTREASSRCYYSRLSGFEGTIQEIISNDNTNAPAIVTIASTDKGFSSSHCGTWTQDLSAITASSTSFEDGIFIVGTDINPGTYQSTGGGRCYYARLKGFGGTVSEIISNDNADGPAIITISKTDKGFRTSGCGVWTKK